MREWGLVVCAVLLASAGCSGHSEQKNEAANLPQVMIVEERPVDAARPATATAKPAPKVAEERLDRLFILWKYPGSTAEEAFAFGDVQSVKYVSADAPMKVAEFYRARLPDRAQITPASATFGPHVERGQALTVTVTPAASGALITLRLAR